MVKEFTDSELAQVAEYVARRYLEVERGLRSKNSLRKLLSPQAFAKQFSENVSRFGKGGVVRQTDLGRMTFQRTAPDQAHVAIPARQQDDRWGALVMEMRCDPNGRWRITELTRVQDRNLVRPQPLSGWRTSTAVARERRDPLADSIPTVRAVLTVAQQRHDKALKALSAIAPEKPACDLRPGDLVNTGRVPHHKWVAVTQVPAAQDGDVVLRVGDATRLRVPKDRPVQVLQVKNQTYEAARDQAQVATGEVVRTAEELARWELRLAEMRREIGAAHRPAEVHDLGRPEGDAGTVAYLSRTLGPEPDAGPARHVWNEAADLIDNYRDRWGITTTDSALGPQVDDPAQREDRDAAVEKLRALTSRLRDLVERQDGVAGEKQVHSLAEQAPFGLAPQQLGA